MIRWGQVTIVAQLWPAFVAEDKGFLPSEALTLDTTVFRFTSDATRAPASGSTSRATGARLSSSSSTG
jgi:hypothetical protein